MLKTLSKGAKCAVILAPVMLASCGGGSGSTATSAPATIVSLSGVVVDGYLEKATVCLDTNGDKSCLGEATKTLTGTKGVFTLKNVSAADAKSVLLVEAIPGTTVDLDDPYGKPLTKAYTLTSPAVGTTSNTVVISPVTTMVQSVIETDPNISTASGAANIVKQKMGLAANDTFDVMSDYVAASASTNPYTAAKAKTVHNIAKVTASVLAANKTNIDAYAAAANVTPQASYDALLADVVKTVLATITTQVNNATKTATGSIDPYTVQSLAQSNAPTVTATTLAAKVAVNTLPATSGSLLSEISNGNVISYIGWWTNNINGVVSNNYNYGETTLNTTTGNTVNIKDFQKSSAAGAWVSNPNSYKQILLSPKGTWSLYSNSQMTFTSNPDGSVTTVLGGNKQKTTAKKINVAGKNIQQFLQAQVSPNMQQWAKTIAPTAVFRTGAFAFDFTDTAITAKYTIRYWNNGGTCPTGQPSSGVLGNCDRGASYWNPTLNQQVIPLKLGDIITLPNGGVKDIQFVGNSNSWARVVLHGATTAATSGTTNLSLTDNTGTVQKGSGTWVRQLIPGTQTEVIRMAMPQWALALNNNGGGMKPSEVIFAFQDGMVRVGKYVPANSVQNNGDINFNKIAMTDILNNFTYQ